MSDVVYRGNLKASSFPFLTELGGRSIIVKGPDQTAPLGDFAKSTTDTSGQGIPQIYYCHNVMPTDNGYTATSFTQVVTPAYPAGTNFVETAILRDSAGNFATLAIDASGNLYVMQYGAIVWAVPLGAPAAATIAGKRMTVAFVSGTTYIYFANVACYVYTFATNTMAIQALAGLTANLITGVVAVRGYMIAYTTQSVFWSSTLTPVDFVPDLTTGAGGGQLEGARGTITTIEAVYGGMIVFTSGNAVAATSSDNVRFPFNFLEITGCGGLANPLHVSLDANSSSLYAYTTAGMQSISLKQAIVVFPEVTDFLSGSSFEDFDESINQFSITNTSGIPIVRKLVVVGSRYLVISYGITNLTHAIVYDLSYKQWGKLKIPHVDCFEWSRTSTEIPKKNIAFLDSGGGVNTLNTDINNPTASGIMILGKYQYVRTRLMQLQRVAFENVNPENTFSLYDLPSLDGKNFGTALVGYLAVNSGKFREYTFHNTALNHTLLAKGGFNAVSIVLTFNITGAR
mgnify:CR=1 FL=1